MNRNIGPNARLKTGAMPNAILIAILAATALVSPAETASAGTVNSQIGYDDLVARLGAGNVPTGASVVVGQVESAESPGNYGPDQANAAFAGKTFTAMSGNSGNSGHATLVAGNLYGNAFSIAPGITNIYLYEANNWVQNGYLRTNQGASNPPLVTPGGVKIFNHSWVGSGGIAFDNDALRRTDFAISRDSLLMICGVNNSSPSVALMSHMFNGISVGITPGTHISGGTLGSFDGPGRMKPEIVAPSGFTSFAAPLVDATAALLAQTARIWPGLSGNPNAMKSETLKAVLLAGGNHRPGWTNNPGTGPNRGLTATPLDPVYGVDVVNVNRSHLIITGLEQNGSDTRLGSSIKTYNGWDYVSIGLSSSKYYGFRLNGVADKVSILAAWNRVVRSDFGSYSLADFNLILWRLDANHQQVTMVGDPGLPWFDSGNVVSQSAIDNVEHLYITNLQPGDYLLEVKRVDAVSGSAEFTVAWLFPNIPLIGDVTHDGHVNVDDLLAVINAWGACPPPCPPTCPADITGNCIVNVDDLLAVINHWG